MQTCGSIPHTAILHQHFLQGETRFHLGAGASPDAHAVTHAGSSVSRAGVPLLLAAPFGLEGFKSPPAALYWTGFVVALSLALWLSTRKTRWSAAAVWAALALAGQACSFQLLWVGPDIRLQLFYGWSILYRSFQGIFLFALIAQAGIVLWGARRFWPALKSRLPPLLSWPAALVFIALEAYAATTIHPEVAQALVTSGFARQAVLYGTKVVLGLLILGVGWLNLALATAAVPEDVWERWMQRWQETDRSRLPWLCALWVVVISSLLAWRALDRMPHLPDEVGYIWQAKYFASGRLYLLVPPDPKAFDCPFQLVDGQKWYNTVPPGWPAVLAVGVFAGAPWLVNPLLGGLAVLLAFALIRRLYDRETAEGTVLLMAASPWLLFLSASFMSHPLTLVCSLLGLLAVERTRETGSIGWGAVAGFGFGLLLHVRALEAALVAGVAGVWWLSAGWRKLRLGAVATACLTGLAMTAFLLAYNRTLTGDPFLVPLNKYLDQIYYPGANRLGFGRDVGNFGWTGLDALPGHGPIDVVMNTNQNLYLMNFELFGWACGSLLFVFLVLVSRPARRDALMWALLFVLWAGLNLYWFSGGPDFGPRYWYQMILPAAVLTIRGGRTLAAQWRTDGGPSRVWLFIALASLLGLANLLPWRSLDKYRNYRGIRSDVRYLERENHFGRSLVLVRGPLWPDYVMAFSFNPATFDRDVEGPIYARELDSEAAERLREYYRDRPVWILAGPTVTGKGFEVVKTP